MDAALNAYVKLNDWIGRICLIVSCCGVAFAIIALTLAAFERHFFGLGYPLLNDLPPLLMPWVVIPLSGVLLRENRHITVDFLPHFLPANGRKVLDLIVGIAVLGLCTWILLGGLDALQFFRKLNQTTETGVRFPIWWIYLAFPVGFGLMAWFAVEKTVLALIRLTTGKLDTPNNEGGPA